MHYLSAIMAPEMCNAVVHCSTPDPKEIYFSLVSYGSLLFNFGDLQAGLRLPSFLSHTIAPLFIDCLVQAFPVQL